MLVDSNPSSTVQVNSEIVSTLSREFMENDEKHVNSCLDSAAQASSTPVLLLAESSGDTVNMMPENDASTGVSSIFPSSEMSNPQPSSRRTPNSSRAANNETAILLAGPLLQIPALVATIPATALIDSGAAESFISESTACQLQCKRHELKTPVKVRGFSGNILVCSSFIRVRITLGKFKFFACLRVVEMHPALILGYPFLEKYEPQIQWRDRSLKIRSQHRVFHIQGATTHPTTIFSGVADSSVHEESACQIEVIEPDNDMCREVSQLTNSTRPNVVNGRILPTQIPTSTKTTFESAPTLVCNLLK